MRSRAEVEIEFAQGALRGARVRLDDVTRWWPASKRGSNAQRALDKLAESIDVLEQCLADAMSAVTKETGNA